MQGTRVSIGSVLGNKSMAREQRAGEECVLIVHDDVHVKQRFPVDGTCERQKLILYLQIYSHAIQDALHQADRQLGVLRFDGLGRKQE